MTAPQLIIKALLERLAASDITGIPEITEANIQSLYEQFILDDGTGAAQDIMYEFREGTFSTDIPPDYSRNYESRSVGAKIGDQYVGWTYWYGGGKHAQPESVEWINGAYFIDLVETKMVPVMIFKKKEG